MTTIKLTVWSSRLQELLADGEWHDGPTVYRELLQTVPPGIALRKTEEIRQAAFKRRQRDPNTPRKMPRSMSHQVDAGRRAIIQNMLSSRAAAGTTLIEPWPVGLDNWYRTAWRLKDPWVGWIALTNLMEQMMTSAPAIRAFIDQDPPLETRTLGRALYIKRADIPEVQRRQQEHWLDTAREKVASGNVKPISKAAYSQSELAERYEISFPTVNIIREATADLEWLPGSSRGWRLSASDLLTFEEALIKYLADAPLRYSEGAKKARDVSRQRAEQRAQQKTGEPPDPPADTGAPVPTFEDPELNELAARYYGGETHLREAYYAASSRVFRDELLTDEETAKEG